MKNNPMGLCRERPPTLVHLGMMEHPVTHKPQPVNDTFWPQVPEHEWCGHWKPQKGAYAKIDLTQITEAEPV